MLFLLLITIVCSCKKKIYTDFSYAPNAPKIGDSVFFTNTSHGGEDFDWTFRNNNTGSVGRSTFENPTRVFTSPGEYSVTLRVDSNDNNLRTRNVYIWDSIPNIARNKETIGFYSTVTFKAVAYNPFNRTKTHQWFFSLNAEGDSLKLNSDGTMKISTAPEPIVYFTKRGVKETVSLYMTVGDSIYTTEQIPHSTFEVEDVASRSLLMAQKDGNILRQRIFENGADEIENTGILAGAHPFNIISNGGEQLFIFDAGSDVEENTSWETNTSGDGSIRIVNLVNNSVDTLISNKGTSSYFGFYTGHADDNDVYWTDRNDFVYKISKDARDSVFRWEASKQNEVSYYTAHVDSLPYATQGMEQGQFNGGIHFYNNLYYLAKGGTGKGIYRFEKDNFTKAFKVLLPDYSIRAFVYDRVHNQIYFSSTNPVGFYVSNIDGLAVRQIDDAPMDNTLEYITGIVIDSQAGKVLWAYRAPESLEQQHKSGIKQIKIVRSDTEKPEAPTYLNYAESIYGITFDNNLKLGR